MRVAAADEAFNEFINSKVRLMGREYYAIISRVFYKELMTAIVFVKHPNVQ